MIYAEHIQLTVDIIFSAISFAFFLGIMILFFGKR